MGILSVVFRSIFEFRWLILFLMAAVLLGTVAVVFRWPDEFTARVHLRVVSGDPSILPSRIKDSLLIQKTVESLKLDEYFGTSTRRAARILRQRVVSIRFLPGKKVWLVSVTADSFRIANRIVDTIVLEYIRSSFEDHLKKGADDLPLWVETQAKIKGLKFRSSQKIAAFYERNIPKEIAALPFFKDFEQKLFLLQQEEDRLVGTDPRATEIGLEIKRLNQDFNKEKQRWKEAARENIQQAREAVDIAILDRIPAGGSPSGPDRIFWLYFNGALLSGLIFLGIILRTIRGQKVE